MRRVLAKIFGALTGTKAALLPNGATIWYSIPKGKRVAVSYTIGENAGGVKTNALVLGG